jgi:hypothetical protein
MPLMTTFFWSNSAYSGSAQLNIGPFFIGFVEKIYKMEVRGQTNIQGVVVNSSSVRANFAVFAVQKVPHGAPAANIITTADSEDFFVRRQTGSNDVFSTFAPSTDTAADLVTYSTADDWAGQLAIGADTDLWVSFVASTGVVLSNFNTFGTVRLWWN